MYTHIKHTIIIVMEVVVDVVVIARISIRVSSLIHYTRHAVYTIRSKAGNIIPFGNVTNAATSTHAPTHTQLSIIRSLWVGVFFTYVSGLWLR